MGRVSRKRKIKQCDPFYKGKQGSGSANYDLPPDHTSKRKKLRRKKILSDSAIEREVLGKCIVSDSTKKDRLDSRRPGESIANFEKRIRGQVKRVLREETKRNFKSTEKRNDFFRQKKLKKIRKNMSDQERYELDYQQTGDREQQRSEFPGVEAIRFGERVDAPPSLPRLKGIKPRS